MLAVLRPGQPITSFSIDLDTIYAGNPGWSHITFFDTGAYPPPPPTPAPALEPMTLSLFGIGLPGLSAAAATRRRSRNARAALG